jgi:glucokinase
MFCGFLGSVAGNAALTFGSRGGVLLAGGIVPNIVDYLHRSPFRERFEGKGRLRHYLSRISTKVIVRRDPTFLGLMALAHEWE